MWTIIFVLIILVVCQEDQFINFIYSVNTCGNSGGQLIVLLILKVLQEGQLLYLIYPGHPCYLARGPFLLSNFNDTYLPRPQEDLAMMTHTVNEYMAGRGVAEVRFLVFVLQQQQ